MSEKSIFFFNPLFFLQQIFDKDKTKLVQAIALIKNVTLIIKAQVRRNITGKQKKIFKYAGIITNFSLKLKIL